MYDLFTTIHTNLVVFAFCSNFIAAYMSVLIYVLLPNDYNHDLICDFFLAFFLLSVGWAFAMI